MKTIKEALLPNGRRRLIVELDKGETLLALHGESHYKLGHPVEDVVPAHILEEALQVVWCPLEQRWAP